MKFENIFLGILVFFLLSGCAAQKEVKKRYFWPPLSDEPKIEYINFYQSDFDVLHKKYGALEEAVFGRERPKLIFAYPYDIYADGADRFFVTEAAKGTVKAVSLSEPSIDHLRDRNGEIKFIEQPLGITGDNDGRIYVAGSTARKIYVFGSDHHLVDEWKGEHFVRPISIAIDDVRARVYVADPGQHGVLVLDQSDGRLIDRIGERGNQDDQFNFPLDIDLDRDGNLYVLDSLNAKVKVFEPDGEFIRSFGERGTALGSFQMPKGIAVSPSGLVYVSDSVAHQFVVFDLYGQYLLTVGGRFEVSDRQISPGGLNLPQGIDVDNKDGLWVIDTLNRMVHSFQYVTDDYLQNNPILPGQAVVPAELMDFGK